MHPIALLAPLAVVVSLAMILLAIRRGATLTAFLSSCAYLASMLAGAAAGLHPVLLPAVGGLGQDITVDRAIAGPHTLSVGIIWWSFGILLALLYFGIVNWLFQGKVPEDASGYGH